MGKRDDLLLAAYALALGYEVKGHNDMKLPQMLVLFDENGIPGDSLQFVLGDVHVWDTARGWRYSRLVDGAFEKPSPSSFYATLKDALDAGERCWRDR